MCASASFLSISGGGWKHCADIGGGGGGGHKLCMLYKSWMGYLYLHARSRAVRTFFHISETAGLIVLKFCVWLWTNLVNAFHRCYE